MPSLHSSTKQNPTSKALVFHQILILQVMPSNQRQCNSDMTVLYIIFDLRFYDFHFWGKTPIYYIRPSRTITLISLSCPLTITVAWAQLRCCCFVFPVLDLAEGSAERLWVKTCVTAASFCCMRALTALLGVFLGNGFTHSCCTHASVNASWHVYRAASGCCLHRVNLNISKGIHHLFYRRMI